jgi:hypothetical protein
MYYSGNTLGPLVWNCWTLLTLLDSVGSVKGTVNVKDKQELVKEMLKGYLLSRIQKVPVNLLSGYLAVYTHNAAKL